MAQGLGRYNWGLDEQDREKGKLTKRDLSISRGREGLGRRKGAKVLAFGPWVYLASGPVQQAYDGHNYGNQPGGREDKVSLYKNKEPIRASKSVHGAPFF